MTVLFREAACEDYDQVRLFVEEEQRLHHRNRPDIFRRADHIFSKEVFRELVDSEDTQLLLATEENAILGICFSRLKREPGNEIVNPRTILWIDDFIVGEYCRRRGIGKALFLETQRRAAGLGAGSVELEMWAFNQAAAAFYRALGLEPQKSTMEWKIQEDQEEKTTFLLEK